MAEPNEQKRLETLGEEVHKAKLAAGLVPNPNAGQASAGKGMQSGFELVGAILGCTLIGILLDRWLNTTPLFMLVFMVAGFVAGLWRAYRSSTAGQGT